MIRGGYIKGRGAGNAWVMFRWSSFQATGVNIHLSHNLEMSNDGTFWLEMVLGMFRRRKKEEDPLMTKKLLLSDLSS